MYHYELVVIIINWMYVYFLICVYMCVNTYVYLCMFYVQTNMVTNTCMCVKIQIQTFNMGINLKRVHISLGVNGGPRVNTLICFSRTVCSVFQHMYVCYCGSIN